MLSRVVISRGFPGGLEVKVSACNAGDLGSIPGSGRSPGEGNGNPLQYSCLENLMDGGAWWATVHGVAESDTTERLQFSLRLVITFLSRSKRLLISWLQLPSAVILEPPKLSLSLCPLFSERSRDPEKNGIWNFQFLFPTKIQKVAAVIVVYLLSHVQLL